jgi:hypothetical protein
VVVDSAAVSAVVVIVKTAALSRDACIQHSIHCLNTLVGYAWLLIHAPAYVLSDKGQRYAHHLNFGQQHAEAVLWFNAGTLSMLTKPSRADKEAEVAQAQVSLSQHRAWQRTEGRVDQRGGSCDMGG